MFKVECLGCQAPYQVDERRVPEKGLKMRCPKCGTTFKVEPPAQGATPSQAPAPEPEAPRTAAPAPFTSGSVAPTGKLGKPPGARDSLARTMIGVSSAEMEQLSKDSPEAKPKAFRIPRPNAAAPDAPAPLGAVPHALLAHDPAELDLPATPERGRSLGLTRGSAQDDAALPELVRSAKAIKASAAGEVQRATSAAPPVQDAAWLDASDGSLGSNEAGVRLDLSDLPSPVVASATRADELPRAAPGESIPPLELDLQDDLPIVASPQKRPPPRRPRAPPNETSRLEDAPDQLARPHDVDVGLPAVVAPVPPPRPIERGQRPPARQRGPAHDELDLPATAPREKALAAFSMARAPLPEAPFHALGAAGLSLDLPSVPRARQAPQGLADAELPTVGRAEPGVDLPAAFRAATKVDLAAAQRARNSVDLPAPARPAPAASMARPAAIPSDLPDVLGAGLPLEPRAATRDEVALPEVLTTGLPDIVSPSLPKLARGHADLPDVLGGYSEASPSSWRAEAEAALPLASGSGLPEVLGGYSEGSAAGLPAVHAAGLPQDFDGELPDVLGVGLPEVHGTGLPDLLASGLPEVHGTGLPDVLSSGLPVVSPAGLPQVRGDGLSGFGRVDLPVPRAADLPETRGRIGFDEVDLPGVGESLPSVSEHWGSANLPAIGETLPTAKGRQGEAFDEAGTPFDAFGDAAEGDPFAGSEADFGAVDADDPFAPPDMPRAAQPDRVAYDDDAVPDAPAPGSGYGEVDIGAGDPADSALETADDMEFQAIPQRNSAPPARAAASASVHTESADVEATGSTLELGPERKTPKVRTRRTVAAVAVALAMMAGGALALKPAIGPFGIHFVMDTLKRGEHQRVLAKLVTEAREAAAQDDFASMQGTLRALEKARSEAPRFWPLSARSAFEHYAVALRFGPLPNLEAAAKVALDQVDADADDPTARLARAAQAAVARSADAKSQLQALGADPDAQALLGELSLRDKEWAAAAKLWGELAKSEPRSARAAFGLARAELGLGKPSEASARAREVLSMQAAHVGARILLLQAERAKPAVSEAKTPKPAATEELVSAVNLALPNAAPSEAALAHCVLGELHASQGRAGPAQQEFEAALVVDRALPRALIGLGEVLHQAGRDTEALARFDAAAQAEPKNLQAQLGIAKAQIQLAHLPEAKAVLARLGESHKDHPEVIFWMGRSEQALGNNDAALAAYRASIKASQGQPGAVASYLALAKLQADLGQLAVAQDTLNEARGKLPPNGPLYKALGEIAMSRADYSGAYEHFQRALELDPGDTRARFLGAVALTRLGRFDEALTAFQSVGQTDRDFPGLAVERGRLFEESGRNAEALAEFEAALKKTPDDPEVQVRVGCSRVVAGRAAEAQQLLDGAAKARPRSAEAQFCLGRALFDQERFTDAMMRLERAVSLDPSRAVYHQFRGWVAIEMGRQGEAEEALEHALELDKGLADAYWLRGRLRLKQGAARDAIVDLERARQLKPTRYDAIADLAVAYADTGRLQKALDSWEEAIAKDADNPTWHFRYGKLLSASGNGQMAAAHLERALNLVAEGAQAAPVGGSPPKQQPWLWQAHYLLARELGKVPASIPHWQAYLRLSARDDPYRPEAERALRELGQPWARR